MQVLAIAVENHSSWMQRALWGLLVSVIMAWVARSRGRTRPASDAHRLQHPPSTLVIGISGFLFFAAIAAVSNIYANATTHWWTTVTFVGFALLALPVLGDYFAARHEVSEEGLRYGRLLGAGGYMRWAELTNVHFSDAMKWFRLESKSGEVVRISVMLMGLPSFAQLLLAHTPAEAIDRQTLPVLENTAEGNPPSVWGASESAVHH